MQFVVGERNARGAHHAEGALLEQDTPECSRVECRFYWALFQSGLRVSLFRAKTARDYKVCGCRAFVTGSFFFRLIPDFQDIKGLCTVEKLINSIPSLSKERKYLLGMKNTKL